MNNVNLNIRNEYDNLNSVILYKPNDLNFFDTLNELILILQKYKINILYVDFVEDSYLQLFVRDPIMVIGNTLFINNMKNEERFKEIDGFNNIIKNIENKEYIPDNVIIEGGDIIVHNTCIFIGNNGNRTNELAIEYLRERFKGKYDVIEIQLKTKEEWIHLDCIMNPISENTLLLYKKGITFDSYKKIKKIFSDIILIEEKEMKELAINVLSIGNRHVISQKRQIRINEELKKREFIIEEIDKYETVQLTGYVRCLTCPLTRNIDHDYKK